MVCIGIVGHNGYIGSYIFDTLLVNGYNVIPIDYRCAGVNIEELSKLDVVIYTGGVSTKDLCTVLSDSGSFTYNV
jgi:UDP-glucose 4-epimerase